MGYSGLEAPKGNSKVSLEIFSFEKSYHMVFLGCTHEMVSGGLKLTILHSSVSSETVVKAEPALAVPAALSSNCALMQHRSSSTGLLRGALGFLARQVACTGPIPRQLQLLLSIKEAAGCDGFGSRRDTGKSVLPAGLAEGALPHTEGIC